MSTYTIGEVAERSGFTASALRYYEGIGLVPPATRTDAGYRLYDDRTLARLAFIGRAKQLGCSLEEIGDLVGVWDGDRCQPVQRRFHELLTTKIADTERQLSDVAAFTSQLRDAARQLSGPPIDGPCGAGCACLGEAAEPAGKAPGALAEGSKPEVPIACTLEGAAVSERVADWQSILGLATHRYETAAGRWRIEFGAGVSLPVLAALVAAERDCCAFLSFAMTVDHRGVGLEVAAPDGADELVVSLFGPRT